VARRPAPSPAAETSSSTNNPQSGLVLAHYGQASLVEGDSGEVLRCSTRRNLPRTVCGDQVAWQPGHARTGVITAVQTRNTILSRPDQNGCSRPVAANMDQIVVVIACRPSFECGMLDRYLVAAELIGADAAIVVNKSDLLDSDSLTRLQQRLAVYTGIGYRLLFTSTRNTDGLTDLHRQLRAHTSILVGQSGVGKSSLVQALLPEQDIRTGNLSQVTGLGRHTTTVAMLYHLPDGGDLIDSPGVRNFTLNRVAVEQLEQGFPELAPYLGQCRFRNCRHVNEPGCAIHNAARSGAIHPQRLESYRTLVKIMS